MLKLSNKYLKQIIVVVIILVLLTQFWNMLLPDWKAAPWWPLFLLFFLIVTLTAHFIILRTLKKSPRKFIGMFMALTLGKLVLYLTVLVLNVIFTPFPKASVIAPFLLYYIVFTFFEVKHLSIIAKEKHENSEIS